MYDKVIRHVSRAKIHGHGFKDSTLSERRRRKEDRISQYAVITRSETVRDWISESVATRH